MRLLSKISETKSEPVGFNIISLVEFSLETDFKDQIRAQLAEIHHYIAGDRIYGTNQNAAGTVNVTVLGVNAEGVALTSNTNDAYAMKLDRRLHLHCSELRISHPISKAN